MSQSTLLSFEQALDLILTESSDIKSPDHELISITNALGRILANDVSSTLNVPSFNASAMDGYALRLDDLQNTNQLVVSHTALAGDPIINEFPKGTCIRIMTGAVIPADADTVVMQENITQHQNTIMFDASSIKKGDNIRLTGENINKNDIVAHCGDKLTIPLLSTIASLGISQLSVFKPLKIALFSTGNELVELGEPLSSQSSIYDSNRLTLGLMIQKSGCELIDLGIINDDLTSIKSTLLDASQHADIIITSGGVSVGDADYTKQALDELGTINFWKIAMKPGKPFAFGRIGQSLFCGLPGNPVSSLITFYQLVLPLIESCYKQYKPRQKLKATLCGKIKKREGRLDFQRGFYFYDQHGTLCVKSTGQQDSHLTTSFHGANCFILLEKDRGNVNEGESVTIEPFNYLLH